MSLSVLNQYQEFFSHRTSTILQKLSQVDSQNTNPIVNTILLWLVYFETNEFVTDTAYRICQKVFPNAAAINIPTIHSDKDDRVIQLFKFLSESDSQNFSKPALVELWQNKSFHLMTELPSEIYKSNLPLPKVIFNKECFPLLEKITLEQVNLKVLFADLNSLPPIKRLSITQSNFAAWIQTPQAVFMMKDLPCWKCLI